jgi:hypothetical protein
VSDIDTRAVDSLKALDPQRPIREADIKFDTIDVCFRGQSGHGASMLQCPLMTLNGHRYCTAIFANDPERIWLSCDKVSADHSKRTLSIQPSAKECKVPASNKILLGTLT